MARLFLIIILVVCGNLSSYSQNDQAIEITWLNAPSETQDNLLTLKWGIKAKSQITNVIISVNDVTLRGINAISNDGYDMVKSQTVNLKEGKNKIEITVLTQNCQKEACQTIICKTSDNEEDEDNEDFNVDVDVVVRQAYDKDSVAQYILGKMYMDGRNNMRKDAFEGSLWFKKSAEAGFPPAMYEYAISLLDGRGIIKSVPLGLEYMKIAGDNEFAPALFIMGIFYEKGNFVEKNVEKAKQLYRKCPLPEAKRRLEALEKN